MIHLFALLRRCLSVALGALPIWVSATFLSVAPMDVVTAAPVCSTGVSGTVSVPGNSVRVNAYYAAPDPTIATTIVPVGATSIPVDDTLGPQATNLHPSVNPAVVAGDILILIQMIGAELDTADNHLNTGDYGDGPAGLIQAGSLNNANFTAGRYEFVVATGSVTAGAIPVEATGLGGGLVNEYVNSNTTTATLGFRRYQVVKVPQFSRLTITGEIVSERWNGRWGGITAINVRETLALDGGTFNADGRGFRGGQFFPTRSDDPGGNWGFKGEGIAGLPQRLFSQVLLAEQPVTNGEETGPIGYPGSDGGGPGTSAWTRDSGLGAPGTAGSGGGGGEDAGGGGGGNAGRGGRGGLGTDANSEGIGGAPFPQHFGATPDRLVMGGGGGSSNGDDIAQLDLTVSSGQAGGGIVFVRALQINASAGGVVSSSGDSGGSAPSEGGGGGGAGGTVLIHTDGSTVNGVAFSAVGGAGGSSQNLNDGGGGGGSGGVILISDTSAGSATFDVAGGALGTGASLGAFNGTAGDAGFTNAIAAIAEFDCNFVTLGVAKQVTSFTRVGSTGAVFDIASSVVVENFSTTTDAVNVQVTDDLAAAFPGAASISVLAPPNVGGFSPPGAAFDGTGQPDLIAGTDTLTAGSQRTISYTVRVDFGSAPGPFSSQARVTSSQLPGSFAQVLDRSDDGSDPDPDGDGDPTESISNGGDSDENDATVVTLDLTVSDATCVFNPDPAAGADSVAATCSGVESGGSVAIPGMTCGAESGGSVSCTGTGSAIGSDPDITTTDAVGNVSQSVGTLTVVINPDSDADGIPDLLEGAGDSDGDGVPDFQDPDSDNDGIIDGDEDMTVPPLVGRDADADGIDDAIDVDQTGGVDANADGVDDALVPDDTDGDGTPDYLDPDSDNDSVPDVIEGNGDTDLDGSPDFLDIDSDQDGIGDSAEADNLPNLTGLDVDADGIDDALDADQTLGPDLNANGIDDGFEPVDTDGDGTADFLDIDGDDDGIPDAVEGVVDTDGDGTPDWRDLDSDSDGILDSAEGPSGMDVDLDGIDDAYDASVTGEADGDGNGIVDDVLAVDADANGIPDADTDADGLPDYLDLDSDADNINDVIEANLPDGDGDGVADAGTTPIGLGALPDTDNDVTPDFQDIDSDDDGIPDAIEGVVDTDGDGAADWRDVDSDSDGILDSAEGPSGMDVDLDGIDDAYDASVTGAADVDGNGIVDDVLAVDADANGIPDADTDADGLPDYRDLDSDNDSINDINEAGLPDVEQDGLVDAGTVPVGVGALQDTDADGQPDFQDTDSNNDGTTDIAGTGAAALDGDGDGRVDAVTDADGDGLPDVSDGARSIYGDATDTDVDDDGIPDFIEGAGDSDGDGIPDFQDSDSDNDGIADGDEDTAVPPLTGMDADDDGIDDAIDVDETGGVDANGDGIDDALAPDDTDGDGTPDYRDLDSDNDGVPDIVEGNGDTDLDGSPDFLDTDSDQDGIDDALEVDNLPILTGLDADADGIDDALDVDITLGPDANANGIDDGLEPVDTDSDGTPDFQDIDSDDDGIPDAIEGVLDTDGDGAADWRDVDSDSDGILDSAEGPSGMDMDLDGIDDAYDASVTGAADVDGNGIVDDVLAVDANANGIPDADTDADGLPDYRDLDSDNDSINDIDEVGLPDVEQDGLMDAGTVPVGVGALPDTDLDGQPDFQDTDSNNDGTTDITDVGNGPLDFNADGRVDDNADRDGDGIADIVDGARRFYGDSGDTDNDGISDADEGIPTLDTDGDGVPDFEDPDSDGDGIPDVIEGSGDSDGDGLPDFVDTDSDQDGISDMDEADNVPPLSGSDGDGDGIDDALDPDVTGGIDSNGNGIVDAFEPITSDMDAIPDYLDPDSDDDGIPDVIEGTPDTDGDGVPDRRDRDSDADGIDDSTEANNIPPLTGVDGDGDGIDDAIDVDITGGTDSDGDGIDDGFEPVDTDGDGSPDFIDTDSDNDGLPDDAETGDTNGNNVPDRLETEDGALRTAVRGAGSADPLLLMVVFMLMVVVRRGWRVALKFGALGLLVVHLLPGAPAHAQDSEDGFCRNPDAAEEIGFARCWYAGVGAGVTHVDPEGQAGGWSTNDDGSSGGRVALGYRFRPRWSVEAAYLDGGEAGLGNVNPALEALIPDASIEYRTPSVMAVYWLFDPRQGWNLLAKAGLSAISNDASDARIPFEKQTSVQLATGLGVLWQSDSRWFLRADADFYDRDHYYLGLSVGAFWGRRAEQRAEPAAAPQPAMVAPPAPEPATPPPMLRPPPVVEPACREVVVALNERIEFELNSAELTAASQAILSATVQRIGGSAGSDPLVRVGAHTDSAGSDAYNLDLSERRAASVRDYLVTTGLAAARIQARGFGEGRPVAENDTAAGRASNRRVEITWQDTDCQ